MGQWKVGSNCLPSYAESPACVPCLRRSGFAQAGEAHYGAQAWVFRSWTNAGRVPFEAPKERGVLRRVPPHEACGGVTGFSPWGFTLPYLIVHAILQLRIY